jgi:hypothetical protein
VPDISSTQSDGARGVGFSYPYARVEGFPLPGQVILDHSDFGSGATHTSMEYKVRYREALPKVQHSRFSVQEFMQSKSKSKTEIAWPAPLCATIQTKELVYMYTYSMRGRTYQPEHTRASKHKNKLYSYKDWTGRIGKFQVICHLDLGPHHPCEMR